MAGTCVTASSSRTAGGSSGWATWARGAWAVRPPRPRLHPTRCDHRRTQALTMAPRPDVPNGCSRPDVPNGCSRARHTPSLSPDRQARPVHRVRRRQPVPHGAHHPGRWDRRAGGQHRQA
eukprot:5479311-Prymnesium_polylepis.1